MNSKILRFALGFIGAFYLVFAIAGCKRTGCKQDVLCVDDFDPKAKKAGDCTGCTAFGAVNYCPEADIDNGQCLFIREFYSDNGDDGWIDVWVADSADNSNVNRLQNEGRINAFPTKFPDCEASDSSLSVIRLPGEYYYEIETQSGQLEWGWVIFREEGCRLLDVY